MTRPAQLIVILLLGLMVLLGSGCGKKVTREVDVSVGEYYTEDEYRQLDSKQRQAYEKALAGELGKLESQRGDLDGDLNAKQQQMAELRSDLSSIQSEIESQDATFAEIEREITYYESLPDRYLVLRGDCLWNIAGQDEIYADPIRWPRLYRGNRDQISDPDLIFIDQVLAVPRGCPDEYGVTKDDWLAKIAGYWEIYDDPTQWTRIYEANRDQIRDQNLIFPEQTLEIPR